MKTSFNCALMTDNVMKFPCRKITSLYKSCITTAYIILLSILPGQSIAENGGVEIGEVYVCQAHIEYGVGTMIYDVKLVLPKQLKEDLWLLDNESNEVRSLVNVHVGLGKILIKSYSSRSTPKNSEEESYDLIISRLPSPKGMSLHAFYYPSSDFIHVVQFDLWEEERTFKIHRGDLPAAMGSCD